MTLLDYVDFCPPDSRCWEWTGPVDVHGYGVISTKKAHRLVYEKFKGKIPTGLVIDHLCRNKTCVNPGHLEPVSIAENVRRGNRHKTTHCPYGHKYTMANTYRRPGKTSKMCKECNRIRANDNYYRKSNANV